MHFAVNLIQYIPKGVGLTGSGRNKTWKQYAAAVCLAAGLLFAGLTVHDLAQESRERAANQLLAEQAQAARQSTVPEVTADAAPAAPEPLVPPPDEPEPPVLPLYAESGNLLAYDALQQANGDLAGWLLMEGAEIDLPVMYTPEDPEYYLHRGFDGSYAFSGCLFLGGDWSPDGNCAIIYGHNMRNGTMFGQLSRYRTLEYAQEHPLLRFDTLTEEREYAVAAAFYSRAYSQEDSGVFRYYRLEGLDQQDAFEDYLRQVRAIALYDTGLDVEFGDRLLVLSTCSSYTENGRFVVIACQKAQ